MKSPSSSCLRGALSLLPLVYVVLMLRQFAHVTQSPVVSKSPLQVTAHRATITALQPLRVEREVAAEEDTPVPAPAPVQAAPNSVLRGRKTMVLVVNYRDWKRCGDTLKSLFETAAEPDLLKVSAHDQIYEAEGEMECVEAYCQLVGENLCRRSQIVTTKVDAKDAKGPTVARYITEKAIGDEDFCLGIDSHLTFTPNWDVTAVQQWESIGNENAILTVYPKDTIYMEDHTKDHQMALMCIARIETSDIDAMVQYRAVRWLDKTNATKPRLMSQFAGGFNFGSCRSYKEVPNDPYTPILFYGEEYVRAARLWTSGYDFYAPSADIVFHTYELRRKIWERDWGERYHVLMRSKRRVRFMMGLPISKDDFDHTELDKYGLGKKRTFDQWIRFSGIDPLAPFSDKTIEQFQNCGELEFVPYK